MPEPSDIEVGMTVTLPPVHAALVAEGPDDSPIGKGLDIPVTEENIEQIRALVAEPQEREVRDGR